MKYEVAGAGFFSHELTRIKHEFWGGFAALIHLIN
jgi:hypothetical protein